jgi:hypothetical protein
MSSTAVRFIPKSQRDTAGVEQRLKAAEESLQHMKVETRWIVTEAIQREEEVWQATAAAGASCSISNDDTSLSAVDEY